jgi:hypothetical protein
VTHPAVDAVLGFIKTNWQAGTYGDIPIERVDRDNSELLDGNVRSHSEDLQASNYVGATVADAGRQPIGTEYDLDVETIAGVRVEGLHHHQRGHVDPDGNEGVPFDELEQLLRDPLWTRRAYPDAGNSRTTYHTLRIENDTQASSDYGSYFRTDFDVRFDGYEDLPAPQHP